MKIAIVGSMTSSKKMLEIEKELAKNNHSVVLPQFTKQYAELNSTNEMHKESAKNKVEHDLIRKYFNVIGDCDMILVVNEKRYDIDGYIGGNSLIEMAFAHILNKKIYLTNPIPKMIYTDEIEAMKPIILNCDLSKIE